VARTDVPARRPGNRKQLIVAAAAEQFRDSGYHNVGVTEIAEAVGITGPALYRHFPGKQDLLLATVRDAIEHVAEVCHDDHRDLDGLLTALGTSSTRRRDTGVLWSRERAHLPAAIQHQLRAELRDAVAPLRAATGNARPTLEAEDVDMLLWATLAVFISPSYHAVQPDSLRFRDRLVESARAVCHSTAVPAVPPSTLRAQPSTPPDRLLPASRRQAVLASATRLFSEQGYQNVGIDEIGAAAGIAGASVYHHFSSKAAILTAAITRCLEAMMFDLCGVFDVASDAGDALRRLVRAYVRTCIEHGEAIGSLLFEIPNLPAEEREVIRQVRRDYVAEWVALLTTHRPALSEAEASVQVNAALTVMNTLLRAYHLRSRPGLADEVEALARATLVLEAGDSHQR
jgi:AcrR family transcriptional regulator